MEMVDTVVVGTNSSRRAVLRGALGLPAAAALAACGQAATGGGNTPTGPSQVKGKVLVLAYQTI
jgi:hypothetical protein